MADVRAIVDWLLERPASQRDLRDELGLQSGSLSRQMRALESGGLVVRERSHGPYHLTLPDQTHAFLQAAADLARDISATRAEVDNERARDLRKTAMRAPVRRREGA